MWFLYKESATARTFFGRIFTLSFIAYAIVVFLYSEDGLFSINYMLHMILLFTGGFFINSFSRSKIIFYLILSLFSYGYVHYFITTSEEKVASGNYIEPSDLAFEAGELLVEIKDPSNKDIFKYLQKKYGLTYTAAFNPADKSITPLDHFFLLDIPKSSDEFYEEIFAQLSSDSNIKHAEVNEKMEVYPLKLMTQNQSSYKNDILNDPYADKLWAFESLEIQSLHQLIQNLKAKAQKKVRIAIIDTGVDADHEDLSAIMIRNGAYNTSDQIGHGTHCAGIVAAISNNKKGIASFFNELNTPELISYRVFDNFGSTSQEKIIDAMLQAADDGADVISMSLGGPSLGKKQKAYKNAVEYAQKKGAVVVAAAGNENINARLRVPASVDGVIAVAAVNENLEKASFSNFVGDLTYGLCAPGQQIYSTLPADKYEYFNGTSMATPYVAALIGLIKSYQPDLDTRSIYQLIKKHGLETSQPDKTGILINPLPCVNELLSN